MSEAADGRREHRSRATPAGRRPETQRPLPKGGQSRRKDAAPRRKGQADSSYGRAPEGGGASGSSSAAARGADAADEPSPQPRARSRNDGRDRSQPNRSAGEGKRADPSGGGPRGRGGTRNAQSGTGREAGRAGGTASRSRQVPTPPELPEDVSAGDLDSSARRELRGLPKDLADTVARHLAMAARLVEDDPDTAYRHAAEARRQARRIGVVREGCGFVAYRAGRWAEALTELRAARRITGNDAYLPLIADCERGVNRPERALSLAHSPEAGRLDRATRVEMSIVESGARRDLGHYDAAVLALQGSELRVRTPQQHSARLFYAYSDALRDAGRGREATEWLARAAAADEAGETDAAERLAEIDGVHITDAVEDDSDEDAGPDGEVPR